MFPETQPSSYYTGCNQSLLRAVPPAACKILEVGCAEGRLGAALKHRRPDRTVFGIECQPDVAARAGERLDRVFCLDVAMDDPPLEQQSLDCVLFGDILEHLVDPEAVLLRLRRFLAPGGVALASIPNLQHHTLLAALLSGDFQYAPAGLLDATHLRFFTGSTILKLFLDAGYEPKLLDAIRLPCSPALAAAAGPLLDYLGLNRTRTVDQLDVYQHIVQGRPLKDVEPAQDDQTPFTFAACVSDDAILGANLLASPCLEPGSPHEVILVKNCPSAAAGLNIGLERAKHEWIVCAHQDVYLPRGWDRRLARQLREAERRFGPIGVAGVYGVGAAEGGQAPRCAPEPVPFCSPLAAERVGWVVDRGRLLRDGPELPARVATLDELLLVAPRDTPLRFDPALGFHLYGADICLQARERGLAVVALGALCLHNSRSVGLPESFFPSAAVFARKWRHRLPVATPCVVIDREGRVHVLGNATDGPRSIVYAGECVDHGSHGWARIRQLQQQVATAFGEDTQRC
ncbi:MAG: methyltransferase domain-containing protein [Isosphaerales bacterium]